MGVDTIEIQSQDALPHREESDPLVASGLYSAKIGPLFIHADHSFFRIGAPGRQIHFHISLLEIALRRTFHCMITLICAVCLRAKKDGAWSYVTPTHYQSGTFSSTAVEDIEIELDR